jgi:N-acetylmuramoyl-L-alanine amidase
MGDATQVVLAVSGPVQPLVQRLSQPERLLIELPYTRLAASWNQDSIAVADGRVQAIQTTQSQTPSVRLTFTLEAIRDYRVAVYSTPHRVVVDLLGAETVAQTPRQRRKPSPSTGKVAAFAYRPAPPLPPGQGPIIVIDPGHGGHDPGALGPTGAEEKTVVLQIAQALRQLIRQEMPQYRVLMTRDRDVFIPLGERARIANKHQAQVFISIHANSSPNHNASGIETWYLSFAASARAKKIAARENMMSENQLSTLELILRDMQETDRINQSTVLAQVTQKALVERVASQYPGVLPRGVEGAPFAVLHRTHMPSILVETAFISNPEEEARLRTPQYQHALAEGILQGLRQFLQTAVVAMR